MKPDTSNWRDHRSYDFVDDLSTEALAWEYLRRSLDYQRQYRDLFAAGAHNIPFDPEAERRWGLRFPCQARFVRLGANRVLVARRQPCSADSRRSARFPAAGVCSIT